MLRSQDAKAVAAGLYRLQTCHEPTRYAEMGTVTQNRPPIVNLIHAGRGLTNPMLAACMQLALRAGGLDYVKET